MSRVVIYTADPCRRCGNAKAMLEARGIAYEEINLSKDPDGRAELARRTGLRTFPQVVVGTHVIGGFDDLLAAADDGRLDAALSG